MLLLIVNGNNFQILIVQLHKGQVQKLEKSSKQGATLGNPKAKKDCQCQQLMMNYSTRQPKKIVNVNNYMIHSTSVMNIH